MTHELYPFSIERVLNGDPVITRAGHSVKEIHYFQTANSLMSAKIACVIHGYLFTMRENGREDQFEESPYDLFMATRKDTSKRLSNYTKRSIKQLLTQQDSCYLYDLGDSYKVTRVIDKRFGDRFRKINKK